MTRHSKNHMGFQWLIDQLPPKRPLRLLDVGCSVCFEGEALNKAGIEFTGIDQDEGSTELARSRFPDNNFICMDALRFDPENEASYDVLLLRRPDLSVQPDQWQRILNRSAGWLVTGGKIFVTAPGKIEATIAQYMLTHAGYVEITIENTENEEESIVMTARPDEQKIKEENIPQLPKGVILWQDEPAPMCDITTGLCD